MPRLLGKTIWDGVEPLVGEKLCVERPTEKARQTDGYYLEFPIVEVLDDAVVVQVRDIRRLVSRSLIESFLEDETDSDDWLFKPDCTRSPDYRFLQKAA